MDELKHRAGEKLEALQDAALTAAGNSKSRVQDIVNHTWETLTNFRNTLSQLWNDELILEGRARVSAWSREALQRLKDGAPPLSPMVLYEELVALFHDRVWRRSMVIFACGLALGGGLGLAAGLKAASGAPAGPACRALHTHDHTVMLVEDAVAPSAGRGEVLVRVQAFSVCALDRATLRGRASALRALIKDSPVTVGRGFAGVVLDAGPGAEPLELGDEVWGALPDWAPGAAAELLTLACVAICGANSAEGVVALQLLRSWGASVCAVAARHHAMALQDLGAHEYVDVDGACDWSALESRAKLSGPWDAVITCSCALIPAGYRCNNNAILKATAPRWAHLDMRPAPLITDRLPTPLYLAFAALFYTYRILRFAAGRGWGTEWLDSAAGLRAGLERLAALVDAGALAPVLDKVYLPQDFESALAHACSEDAFGTTVVRFP